jgi:hypothetical protein
MKNKSGQFFSDITKKQKGAKTAAVECTPAMVLAPLALVFPSAV